MTKRDRIADVYKLLVEFEELQNNSGNTTLETYLNHLDRVCTIYLGRGNMQIYEGLRGLSVLGDKASHGTVKRMVFHIINLLYKEG